jgi:hypothetical protein
MFWLPADEFEFSGQRVQFAVPLESLYVPTRQALHWPFETPMSGPVYPVLHEHPMPDQFPSLQTPVVHAEIFCGLLFNAQQSPTVVVAESDLNPAGHSVQYAAPLAFENVSGAQGKHEVVAIASWY